MAETMLTRLIREINACASRMEQQHNETKQLVVNLMESGNLRNASINASLSEIESALALQGRKTLTISEAATRAKKKPATIRRWLNDGLLKGTKGGSRKQSQWRIRRHDLDAFLERAANSPE